MSLLGAQGSQEGPGGPNLVPTATNCSAWIKLMVTTHFGLVSAFFWATRGPKRATFGPKCPFWVPRGPRRAQEDQIWWQLPPTAPPGLNLWLPHTLALCRPSSGPPGALKGPLLAQNVPFGGQIWVRNICCLNIV